MHASAVPRHRWLPSAPVATAISALFVFDSDRDGPRVAVPRPEVQLVVRLGNAARDGLDVHAFGARRTVHRKQIRGGQRSVTARLRLGAPEAVLGVPGSLLAERIVPLEDLWGEASTRSLRERLASAGDSLATAAILESAIAERLSGARLGDTAQQLALAAADRLQHDTVTAVARALGVSERHLRRVFRATIGVSPKDFAKLTRFQRALEAARASEHASWASIAVAAGYYDQAHLIAEFRSIAGVTPRVLLSELRAAV